MCVCVSESCFGHTQFHPISLIQTDKEDGHRTFRSETCLVLLRHSSGTSYLMFRHRSVVRLLLA